MKANKQSACIHGSLAAQAHGTPVCDSAEDGLQVTRVPNKSPRKPTNGLLLVHNRTSSVCGKTEVLPDGTLGREARAHDLVEFTCG